VNDSKAVRSTSLEDDELLEFRKIDKLGSIGRSNLPKASGRLAPRIGFELVGLAIIVDRSCPRLERNLAQGRLSWILVLLAHRRRSRRWVSDCEGSSGHVP